jgi:single-strand DNA-binding protein
MSNVFSGLVRIGSDPELRFIPSGKAVLTFSAASSTGFGDKQKTLWLRATCWNKAEKMKEFLVKGNQISITGELSQTEYQAKDGSTKTSLDLNVHSIDLVGKKSEGGQQQAPQPRQAPANDLPYDDNLDIPF